MHHICTDVLSSMEETIFDSKKESQKIGLVVKARVERSLFSKPERVVHDIFYFFMSPLSFFQSIFSGTRIRTFFSILLGICLLGYLVVPAYAKNNTSTCNSVNDVPAAECLALLSLYDGTGGDDWINSQSDDNKWGVSRTVNDWYGVDVWAGHVVGL